MSEKKKKSDSYQLSELDNKDQPGEDQPLKPNDNDVETGGEIANEKAILAAEDQEKSKSASKLLDHPKARLYLSIAGGVILLLLLVVLGAIAFIILNRGWEPDRTWRYLRIIPQPNGPNNLIRFRRGTLPFEGRDWPDLVKEIDQFLAGYHSGHIIGYQNVTQCMPDQRSPPPGSANCFFDVSQISPECIKPNYGYDTGSPCVFLQFNNITNWIPELYTKDDLGKFEDLPEDVRFAGHKNQVLIQCKPNSEMDSESLANGIDLRPHGFPAHFFPYVGHPHYMPPFVALKLERPANGVGIGITCRLWDKSLNSTDTEPTPIIPFSILID